MYTYNKYHWPILNGKNVMAQTSLHWGQRSMSNKYHDGTDTSFNINAPTYQISSTNIERQKSYDLQARSCQYASTWLNPRDSEQKLVSAKVYTYCNMLLENVLAVSILNIPWVPQPAIKILKKWFTEAISQGESGSYSNIPCQESGQSCMGWAVRQTAAMAEVQELEPSKPGWRTW